MILRFDIPYKLLPLAKWMMTIEPAGGPPMYLHFNDDKKDDAEDLIRWLNENNIQVNTDQFPWTS